MHVIMGFDDPLLKSVHVSDMITDHSLIIMDLEITKPEQTQKTKSVRKFKAINIDKFCYDLETTSVITIMVILSLSACLFIFRLCVFA